LSWSNRLAALIWLFQLLRPARVTFRLCTGFIYFRNWSFTNKDSPQIIEDCFAKKDQGTRFKGKAGIDFYPSIVIIPSKLSKKYEFLKAYLVLC